MKNLIKIILAGVLASTGSLMIVSTAFAATVVTLAPATVSVAPGSTFTVTIAVNPQGTANYAEKVELTFPADLLEVKSFALASNWMALTQSGYDLTDNTNGVLLKSAGYPSGLTGLTTFGTVTFSAKKSGNGTIKIGNNSLAFEASIQTTATGVGAIVTIVAPTTAPVVKTQTTTIKPEVTTQTNTTVEQPTQVTTITPTAEASNQVAAASASGFNWNWLWIPAVLILAGIAYFFVRKGKKA